MTGRGLNEVDIEQLTNELSETLLELRKTIDCLTNPFILIMRSTKKGTIGGRSSAGDAEGDAALKNLTINKAPTELENPDIILGKHTQDRVGHQTVIPNLETRGGSAEGEGFFSVRSLRIGDNKTAYDKKGNLTHARESATNSIIKARILKRVLGNCSRDVLNSLLRAGSINQHEHFQLASLLPPEQEKKGVRNLTHMGVILATFVLNIESASLNPATLYGGGGLEDVDRD
jgi:hypothetical protein